MKVNNCITIEKYGVRIIIIKDYDMNDDDSLMYARMAIEDAGKSDF